MRLLDVTEQGFEDSGFGVLIGSLSAANRNAKNSLWTRNWSNLLKSMLLL